MERNPKVVVRHESVNSFKECLELSCKYLIVEFKPRFEAETIFEKVTGVMKRLDVKVLERYHLIDPTSKDECIVIKFDGVFNFQEILYILYQTGFDRGMICYLIDKLQTT